MEKLFKGVGSKNNLAAAKKAFDKLINVLQENGHILKSEYVNSNTKVLVDFQCGHEPHWITPSHYNGGRRCPKCSKSGKSYGKEAMIKLVQDNGHEMLTEYINAHTKVLIDFKCGHESHWTTPTQYKGGHGCPKCTTKSPEEAKAELIQMIEDNGHALLSEYINTNTKVLVDFKCGHEPNWIKPVKYKSGRRCPKCPDITQINAKNRFINKMKEMGFVALTEYKTLDKKVLIDYGCGHEPHFMSPRCILSGQGCPKCKSSKGVKRILKYLQEINIEYQTELRLENERFYDIHIPSLNLIIEVHGEQHYIENNFFKRSLEEEQLNDKMKEEYAKSLGYNYMVIDYKEHDPDLALKRFKNQLKKYIEVI